MRIYFYLASILVLLAACGGNKAPEAEEYFDTLNPQLNGPLRIEEERLRRAERASLPPAAVINEPAAAAPNDQVSALINEAEAELAPKPLTPEESQAISNSQDFEAVSQRETIETDAAKLEELKRTYTTFETTTLPSRNGGVDLALFASQNAGRAVGRSRFSRKSKDYVSNYCDAYVDANLAQVTFLLQGGPKKDPLLLDRDGDGFACGWTPSGYQASRRAAQYRPSPAAQ